MPTWTTEQETQWNQQRMERVDKAVGEIAHLERTAPEPWGTLRIVGRQFQIKYHFKFRQFRSLEEIGKLAKRVPVRFSAEPDQVLSKGNNPAVSSIAIL